MKLTAKQEAFAQAIASGVSQADAYRMAYNHEGMQANTVHSRACELAKDSKVAARIAELRAPVIEAAQLTLKSHLEELERLSQLAEKDGKWQAAIKAQELRGKVSGLYVEKIDANVNGNLTVEIVRYGKEG